MLNRAEEHAHLGHETRDRAPLGAPTLTGLLQQRVAEYRDKVAFNFSYNGEEVHGKSLTYQDLDIKARQIASSLQQQGATGERVLVLCPPGLDFVAGFFGCLYAGFVAIPVHPPMREHLVPRVASNIADVRPRFALTTAEPQAKIQARVDD